MVNRPAELASQLRALDRLARVRHGGQLHDAATRTDTSRRRLHERLRSSCYLRRRKDDVLEQLPDKRRAVVTVPLDNEAEYRRAERDFIRWLREQIDEDGTGRVAAGRRAEALVKMTALRRLAAEGKLAAALAWIDDFRESEEKLVVFAHHRDIQAAVIERFPDSARIVGADSMEEREANVRRFQADDGPELCVCSLEVGVARLHAHGGGERRVPRARVDAGEARPGRGPDPPDRADRERHGLVPARGGDDRRADRGAAGGEARGRRLGDRRRRRRRRVDRRGADRRLRVSERLAADPLGLAPAPSRVSNGGTCW